MFKGLLYIIDNCNFSCVCQVFVIGPDKRLKLSILYPATTGRNFEYDLRLPCLRTAGWFAVYVNDFNLAEKELDADV